MKRDRSYDILVGTDLLTSERAVARAATVARVHRARLHVLHATSKLPRALRSLVATDAAKERRQRSALAAIAAELGDALDVSTHLAYGGAAACLRSKAHELGAALVVLGSRGRTLVDAVVGSTGERVLEPAGPPVLVARDPGERAYRRVVVALAVGSDARRAVAAVEIASPGVKMSLVHVCSGPFEDKLALEGAGFAEIRTYRQNVVREARATMQRALASAKIDTKRLRVVYGQPWRVLCNESARGTLLVLDRGESGISRTLFGGMSRAVIEQSKGDILLV